MKQIPLLLLLLLLLLPVRLAMFKSILANTDEIDFYDELESELNALELEEQRKFQPDEDSNEPPETNSQIANFFYDKMLQLMQTNEGQYVDSIAKYTNDETQLLSCRKPGEQMNFAAFNQLIRYLFLFFKTVDAAGTSFTTDSTTFVKFEVKYNAVSQENKAVGVIWKGEAKFDDSLKHYVFSKLELAGDCSQMPDEFPLTPTETLPVYLDRLKNSLFKDVFAANPLRSLPAFRVIVREFVIKTARIMICEKNGKAVDRSFFGEFLFKRYGEIDAFSDLEFTHEAFNDYQTDAFLTVTVNHPNGDITKDTIRFRISAQSEVIHGWPHWWVEFIEVQCYKLLNPKPGHKEQKGPFVTQVCESISPMVNNGPSEESRITFLSHLNKRNDAGFWAVVCEEAPRNYDAFKSWLATWVTESKTATLTGSTVIDEENFKFECVLQIAKESGATATTRKFEMKAFYETDEWLVKEIRISC
ncbi:unnamed protein product [Caenorhabditis sp. 36 PRJEB53466]|nr:unnamed protein product [Caenorhabditis sp. 36 PRJEB53466]